MNRNFEDNQNNSQKLKINKTPHLNQNINKYNSLSYLQKLILKNKVNKIIKIYRNFHKKKELNTLASTRNNTDSNTQKNIFSNNYNNYMNNNTSISNKNIPNEYIGNKDNKGNKNGYGIILSFFGKAERNSYK